jgi:hypothetical protein
MSDYAVRRLGLAPCTEQDFKMFKKRERIVKSGDKKMLAEFDAKYGTKLRAMMSMPVPVEATQPEEPAEKEEEGE